MERPPLTCDDVQERDLETRYLAGTLDEAEAEAFEAHYFACDQCWTAVHGGLSVRAAGEPEGSGVPPGTVRPEPEGTGSSPSPARRSGPFRAWIPLAAAAVLVTAVATWRIGDGDRPTGGATFRGETDALRVTASREAGGILAGWASVTGADRYIVRLYDARGALLTQVEGADTTARLAPPAARDSLFVDVQALGPLREVLARSAVTAVAPGPMERP